MMCRLRTLPAGIIAALLMLLTSCHKDPGIPAPTTGPLGVVKLTVKPTWNSAPFDKHLTYLAAGGQRVEVSLVKFYLSPLALPGEGGAPALFDADLFDVTNGPQERIISVPTGLYHTLHLGLGLPPSLNHRDIATIPPNSPTGNNGGMYWDWGSQYRFMLFEGKFDTVPNASGPPLFNFSIHTGLDTCYRARLLPINLLVEAGDTAHLVLNVDISRFFVDGTRMLLLSQGAMWHGDVDQLDLGLKVADLQVAAFSVE